MKQAILQSQMTTQNQTIISDNGSSTTTTAEISKSTISTLTTQSMQRLDAVSTQMNQLEFETRAQFEQTASNFELLTRAQMNMHSQQKLHSAVMGFLAQGINELAAQTNTVLNPQTMSITQVIAQGKLLLGQQDGLQMIEQTFSPQTVSHPPKLPPINQVQLGNYIHETETFFSLVNESYSESYGNDHEPGTNPDSRTLLRDDESSDQDEIPDEPNGKDTLSSQFVDKENGLPKDNGVSNDNISHPVQTVQHDLPELEEIDSNGNVIHVSSDGLQEIDKNGNIIISSSQEELFMSETQNTISSSAQREPEASCVSVPPNEKVPPSGGKEKP